MAERKMTHVNAKSDYPGGRGVVVKRGQEYDPTPEELKAEPRRWAPIGSRWAKVCAPNPSGPGVPGVTVTPTPPKAKKGGK